MAGVAEAREIVRSIGVYSWSFDYPVLPQGSVSLEGMLVTADYFRVLGLEPLIGRTFLASEIRRTRRA